MDRTGSRGSGRITRNSCPPGSPSPQSTVQPSRLQAAFIAAEPKVSRTITRVSAADGFAAAVTKTRINNHKKRFIADPYSLKCVETTARYRIQVCQSRLSE